VKDAVVEAAGVAVGVDWLGGDGLALAGAGVAGTTTGALGCTGAAATATVAVTIGGVLARARAGLCALAGLARCAGARRAAAGARPLATDSGSEARPIRCPASWLADHATAAAATIPSSAATQNMTLR
jgi:hypothetical protein